MRECATVMAEFRGRSDAVVVGGRWGECGKVSCCSNVVTRL